MEKASKVDYMTDGGDVIETRQDEYPGNQDKLIMFNFKRDTLTSIANAPAYILIKNPKAITKTSTKGTFFKKNVYAKLRTK